MVEARVVPPARILVVDDVAENRELARIALEDEGYQVSCAASGEEALERFTAERPDCVLLDIRMPRLDGFATCARLRGLPGGPEAAILFLTALRDVDNFDQAVAAGGDDFLTKPIRPTELVVRVRSQLELKRMDSALKAQVDLIRRQRDDLVRLQLHKERLTGFLVHDLKNPVAAIDVNAQLLARLPGLPASAAAPLAGIRRSTGKLQQLILDLLDLGKGEEGRLEVRRAAIDLAALVGDVVDGVKERAAVAGIELRASIDVAPGSLQADPMLVRRVLDNLVDNALRHTPRGGHIDLAARGDGATVELVVADSGPGVPPELREAVFERYVQLEPGGSGGRGIGLAFCRVAMEAHGGSIALDPTPTGASFRLRFPRA